MTPPALPQLTKLYLKQSSRFRELPAVPLGPAIPPVQPGQARPFWSVMIPTYNRKDYLREALESVLAQDPGPEHMQIQVVDNFSSKFDPLEIIAGLTSPGRVEYFRQPELVYGFLNWNTCIERSRGHWVHMLHDDDFVLPGFYERLRSTLELNPTAGSAVTRVITVRADGVMLNLSPLERETPGVLEDWAPKMLVHYRTQCVSIVVNRAVYESLGAFRTDLLYASDWEMWKRIALHTPICYEPNGYGCYRVHATSGTSEILKTDPTFVEGCLRAIDVTRSYTPDSFAQPAADAASEYLALETLVGLNGHLVRLDYKAAARVIHDVLQASRTPRVVLRILRTLLLWPPRLIKYRLRYSGS